MERPSCLRTKCAPFFVMSSGGVAVPAWVPFNWGSRGPAYNVGGIFVMPQLFPNTLQVDLRGHDESNDLLLHVFHVRTPAAPTLTDCTNVATAVGNWVESDYKTLLPPNISVDDVIVTDVSAVDSFQTDLPLNKAGTAIGIPAPSNVTLSVKKQTGRSGRSYRG